MKPTISVNCLCIIREQAASGMMIAKKGSLEHRLFIDIHADVSEIINEVELSVDISKDQVRRQSSNDELLPS